MVTGKNFPYRKFTIPNDKIKDAADQYREAALVLFRQPPSSGILPLLTIAAFSIELYLKSLNAEDIFNGVDGSIDIVTARPLTSGHHLVSLLDSVDSEIACAMKDAFQRSELGGTHSTLQTELQKYDNLFVDSRYMFESPNGLHNLALDPLVNLVEFMHDFAQNMPPTSRVELS